MNAGPGGAGSGTPGEARCRTRQAVSDMLAGSGLHISERTYELVISNTWAPERGQIHVDYEDGRVSWERLTWDHWDALEGLGGDHTNRNVSAGKIITTLTNSIQSPYLHDGRTSQ